MKKMELKLISSSHLSGATELVLSRAVSQTHLL